MAGHDHPVDLQTLQQDKLTIQLIYLSERAQNPLSTQLHRDSS